MGWRTVLFLFLGISILTLVGQRHFGEICYCKWWCKNVIGIRYGGGGMHDLM